MKPHPRIRKTIKWGGAAVTLLLAVAWIGGGWWSVDWCSGAVHVQFGFGLASLIPDGPDREPGVPDGWFVWAHPFDLRWWNTFYSGDGLIVPLWAPTMAALGLTATAWRLDTLARRRARLNLCPKCHYDRSGLAPAGVCPECGTTPQV